MKENFAKLPFQSNTLLIENSQNQWLKYKLIKTRWNRQKQKKTFSQLH